MAASSEITSLFHSNEREVPEELRHLRLPSADERREVARLLKLTPDQSERLWRQVAGMCQEFMAYWMVTPQPGAERRALRQEMRQLSNHLAAAESSLANASMMLKLNIVELVGPLLAANLDESAYWQGGQRPTTACSSEHIDFLERQIKENQGLDQTTVNHFLALVGAYQHNRRQNASRKEAIRLLRTLLHEINTPLREFLRWTGDGKGGAPIKWFRHCAVSGLATVFEDLTGERPTSTAGGRFIAFCDQVLVSIGMDTGGLEDAVKRVVSVGAHIKS